MRKVSGLWIQWVVGIADRGWQRMIKGFGINVSGPMGILGVGIHDYTRYGDTMCLDESKCVFDRIVSIAMFLLKALAAARWINRH